MNESFYTPPPSGRPSWKERFQTRLAQFRQWVSRQSSARLFLYTFGGVCAAGLLFVLLLAFLVRNGAFGALPTYGELKNIRNDQASELYSADKVLLGRYYIENRIDASMDEISPNLIEALVSTEDARFFEHGGVDVRAWGRVLVKSVLLGDESSGGGSTLSQQLAKNLFPRRDYAVLTMPINKLREMFIARRLERTYSKEELLSLYLNTVPFGDNAFGIKVASRRFFSKSPEQLKPEEAAVLVGMLKGVTMYNPRRNPERALERRNVVLAQMVKFGHLDAAVAESLKKQPIKLNYQPESHNEGLATHFREKLRHELADILADYTKADGSPYNLYTDGLRIFTTIDSRMQRYAERAVAEYMPKVQDNFNRDWRKRTAWGGKAVLDDAMRNSRRYQGLSAQGYDDAAIREIFDQPVSMTVFDWKEGEREVEWSPLDSLKYYLTLLNTGLLAAESGTGLVKAWVGGINHKFVQYDHVLSKRQIGSTIKPVVYTAALQSGVLPCEYTPNVLTAYAEYQNWEPRNSDGQYGGAYSLEGALSHSINTVAVSMALRAGLGRVTSLAADMGIEGDIPEVPAVALGAVSASLEEMVTMYATFANRGRRPTRLHYLDRIETADGEVIVKFDRPDPSDFPRVFDTREADIIVHMLEAVVDSGTARRLRYEFGVGGEVAGKTGTTQDQSDGWFLGFNPKLVAGVWVGAENPSVHFRSLSRGQSSSTALPIWGRFMQLVYKDNGLRDYRRGSFTDMPDSTLAWLQCPHFLPEMPIADFYNENFEDINEFNDAVRGVTIDRLREILEDRPRREGEDLEAYGERVRERSEEMEGRDERRQKAKEFWSKLLFGKKEKEDEKSEEEKKNDN